MNRPRVAASVLTVLTLTGLTALASVPPPAERAVVVEAMRAWPTTTTGPDFAVLVESGAVTATPPEEQELTDEALERMSTTTTTSAPETTTSMADPETTTTSGSSEPRPTSKKASPPTTSPPATTTTTSPPTTSPPTTAPTSGKYVPSAENDFVSRINSYRGSNSGGALSRSGSLDSYARSWAKKMAKNGGLSHSNIGSLLGTWSAVGENIAVGGSVGQIFDALVASGSHRANMLADFTHVGVGVWRDAEGALWTCHVFTR